MLQHVEKAVLLPKFRFYTHEKELSEVEELMVFCDFDGLVRRKAQAILGTHRGVRRADHCGDRERPRAERVRRIAGLSGRGPSGAAS